MSFSAREEEVICPNQMKYLCTNLNPSPTAFPLGLCPVNYHLSCLQCQLSFSTGLLSALTYNRILSCFFSSFCVLICRLLFSPKLIQGVDRIQSLLPVGQGHAQLLEGAHTSCHQLHSSSKPEMENLSCVELPIILCLSLQKEPSLLKASYNYVSCTENILPILKATELRS